jgi:hypothetical protein
MGAQSSIDALITEMKSTRAMISERAGVADRRFDQIEASVDELYKRTGRPGGESYSAGRDAERRDAVGLCLTKHMLTVPKDDGIAPDYEPSSMEIEEALVARKALEKLFRTGELNNLDVNDRKALTSFTFGGNSFILSPQMSDRVLSCLVEPFNLAGLMHNENISAGSLNLLIDNATMDEAAWACQVECFANNPQSQLAAVLGEMEIKAESVSAFERRPGRHGACGRGKGAHLARRA